MTGGITSNHASQQLYKHSQLLQASNVQHGVDLFLVDPPRGAATEAAMDTPYSTQSLDQRLFPEEHRRGSWLPSYLRLNAPNSSTEQRPQPHKVVFYQTVGANTGGTTAIHLLHRTLLDNGFHTVICNETNRFETMCTTPHGK